MSWLFQALCSFLADNVSEKFITKLEARRDVDETCSRLDSLTRDVAEALDVACDRTY